MKRILFFAAAAVAAVSLASCGEKEQPRPDAPSITLEGLDIKAVHEITGDPMTVKVNVKADGGISGFAIGIESPVLTEELLGSIGLATEMELTAPASDDMATALRDMGFPVGGDVTGVSALSFDISSFVPLIKELYGGHEKDSNHNFELTVTDASGQRTTETLKFHISAAAAKITYKGDADPWFNTATLSAEVQSGGTVAIEYRRAGSETWRSAAVTDLGNGFYEGAIAPEWIGGGGDGLWRLDGESGVFAGASYECRVTVNGEEAAAAGFDVPAGCTVPNGDMQVWSQYIGYSADGYGKVWYPNESAEEAFWSNGNNTFTQTLCTPYAEEGSEDKCALLKGKSTFGIFAAGNLFTGEFEMNGISGYARFGRKYDFAARPRALKFRYKASVGKIVSLGLKEGYLTTEDTDPAMVFVCITDWTDRHAVHSGLGVAEEDINAFDPATDASTAEGDVIAFGTLTVTESADGWTEAVLPLEFRHKERKPAEGNYSLVISCASSKYGDYLCGNPDNELYLDDFEWVY